MICLILQSYLSQHVYSDIYGHTKVFTKSNVDCIYACFVAVFDFYTYLSCVWLQIA